MADLLELVEKRRLSLGQTQAAVASACGITQPHYSKVVGRLVGLTDDLERRMQEWLEGNPATAGRDEHNSEIVALTREIFSSSRRLASLLSKQGRTPPRRGPRGASRRPPSNDATRER